MSSNPNWLDLVISHGGKVPEDVTLESAIHSIVDLLNEANLTEEQQATLVGVAALMYRYSFQEFQSGIRAGIAIKKMTE